MVRDSRCQHRCQTTFAAGEKYSHTGFYDLQTAPLELKATIYYVLVRNGFGRPTKYQLNIEFDAPREEYVDSEFPVFGSGDKLMCGILHLLLVLLLLILTNSLRNRRSYFYFNLTNGNEKPFAVEARINSEINQLVTRARLLREPSLTSSTG